MKKETKKIKQMMLFLIMSLICTVQLKSYANVVQDEKADETYINMYGQFSGNSLSGERSIESSSIPFVVSSNGHYLFIEYENPQCYINVIISNNQTKEILDQRDFSQSESTYIVISIEEYNVSEFLIEIQNPTNGYVYGIYSKISI